MFDSEVWRHLALKTTLKNGTSNTPSVGKNQLGLMFAGGVRINSVILGLLPLKH